MKTKIFSTSNKDLQQCAQIIRAGGLVAFPTETVYGLGASALDVEAVAKIFRAKGRPSDNPLIVHVASKEMLANIASDIPHAIQILIDQLMPAALSVVVPNKAVPSIVTAGLDTVAVRMPSSAIATRLIQLSGVPICAPSANLSSRPSPTNMRDVYADMNGRIDAIIDGGDCDIGLESTVVIAHLDGVRILREGGVPQEVLSKHVQVYENIGEDKVAISPGTKYRHYAPSCPLVVVTSIEEAIAAYSPTSAILCMSSQRANFGSRTVIDMGENESSYAHKLFATLRQLETSHSSIIALAPTNSGIGKALYNRLSKASSSE